MTSTENERDRLAQNLRQESESVAVLKEKILALEKSVSEKSKDFENQLKIARSAIASKENETSARQIEIEKLKSELENRGGTIETLEIDKKQQNDQIQNLIQQLKDKVIINFIDRSNRPIVSVDRLDRSILSIDRSICRAVGGRIVFGLGQGQGQAS